MAQVASLTINDTQTTPVAHVFAISNVVNTPKENSVLLEDRASGQPLSFNQIRWSMIKPDYNRVSGQVNGNRLNRVKIDVAVPITETPVTTGTPSGYTAPPALAYVLRCKCELILPERSTTTQRTTLQAYLVGALQGAITNSMVGTLEPAYT